MMIDQRINMQVFMPYIEPHKSVRCLDPSRQGNQVYRECYMVMVDKKVIHPASKIWVEHKHQLALYALHGLMALWERKWYYPHWIDYFNDIADTTPDTGMPSIIGYGPFHASHRSQLLAKDYGWYSQFGWSEKPGSLDYVWEI